MTYALVPMQDIEKMGQAIAKSGLFGMKTADQAIALMLIAQAEGMHPAIAARDYHVIQGRPALKADAMLARFQAAGGKVNWDVYTDTEVKGTFSHPAGGSITLSWTLEQARKIGLTGKDNWKNYPRAMLRARVVSEGIRTVYPGCIVGTYTPEEVQDFDVKTPRDMGAAEVVVEAVAEVWNLHIPNKDSVEFGTKDEWIDAFLQLAGKVINSKLDNETKQEKIAVLKEGNSKNFAAIGIVESAKIYRGITEMFDGVLVEKKPQDSLDKIN